MAVSGVAALICINSTANVGWPIVVHLSTLGANSDKQTAFVQSQGHWMFG
jgi:hypothetical protein